MTETAKTAEQIRAYIDNTVADTAVACLKFLLTDIDEQSEKYLHVGGEIPNELAQRAERLQAAMLEILKIKEENTKED